MRWPEGPCCDAMRHGAWRFLRYLMWMLCVCILKNCTRGRIEEYRLPIGKSSFYCCFVKLCKDWWVWRHSQLLWLTPVSDILITKHTCSDETCTVDTLLTCEAALYIELCRCINDLDRELKTCKRYDDSVPIQEVAGKSFNGPFQQKPSGTIPPFQMARWCIFVPGGWGKFGFIFFLFSIYF